MAWPSCSNNCQLAAFILATVGWVLASTCMGLSEWRVWRTESLPFSPSSVVCVGMWKMSDTNRVEYCQHYSYRDIYLPLDVRVSQYLLLVASILGLLERASVIFALRNLYIGSLPKEATVGPFIASGILNITAGVCVSIAVAWNYHPVTNKEGIAFPPSLCIPFKPETQVVGSTVLVACLGAVLMLWSGLVFISYRHPNAHLVCPQASEV
ncbi:claudin-34 [Suricata suricatta]|uniref:claudin-34 n=1 Tax=Suricata suricatta TaxID=37032 RepID=UPI00115542A7|nr:claudin-34 [Suricata suricatta]